MTYPSNWDQLESEYYKHHDPYDGEGLYCDHCEAIERDFCICEEEENE